MQEADEVAGSILGDNEGSEIDELLGEEKVDAMNYSSMVCPEVMTIEITRKETIKHNHA